MLSRALNDRLTELRRSEAVEVYERVELRTWSVLQLGGLADLMIRCGSAGAVQAVVDLLASHGQPWHVLGSGSRTILPDRGLRVPVLALGGELRQWELDASGVVAGGGARLTQLCRAAVRSGLVAGDHVRGASGTAAGSIVSWLGRRSVQELERDVEWFETVRPGAETHRQLLGETLSPGLRDGLERGRGVIVRARLRAHGGSAPSAPRRPSRRGRGASSAVLEEVFVEPEGVSISELLESSGCRALTVGGARLCENGANRIITAKRVRSENIVKLIRTVQERVRESTGTALELGLVVVDEHGQRVLP